MASRGRAAPPVVEEAGPGALYAAAWPSEGRDGGLGPSLPSSPLDAGMDPGRRKATQAAKCQVQNLGRRECFNRDYAQLDNNLVSWYDVAVDGCGEWSQRLGRDPALMTGAPRPLPFCALKTQRAESPKK